MLKQKAFIVILSKIENLSFLAFSTDLLQIFSRFHKTTQNDDLTFLSLVHGIRSLRSNLLSLTKEKLLGGWEGALAIENVQGRSQTLIKGGARAKLFEKRGHFCYFFFEKRGQYLFKTVKI